MELECGCELIIEPTPLTIGAAIFKKTMPVIDELVYLVEHPSDEADARIPDLLTSLLEATDPEMVGLAEEAFMYYRATMLTCPHEHPKVWNMRYGRFINMVDAIHNKEIVVMEPEPEPPAEPIN